METVKAENGVVFVRSALIPFPHGFSTRICGQSQNFNLAYGRGDSDETVRENLALFCGAIGLNANSVVSFAQVHGTNVRPLERSDAGLGYFRPASETADGYVSACRGVFPLVKTADCVPILLCDPEKGVIGALHAGWRGTVAGITAAAVLKMTELGSRPSDIRAAIGPCIGKCHFAVRDDFIAAVRGSDMSAFALQDVKLPAGDELCAGFTETENGVTRADLAGMNRAILAACGLEKRNIDVAGMCTYCGGELFYSHRRMGEKRGTMGAVIGMP